MKCQPYSEDAEEGHEPGAIRAHAAQEEEGAARRRPEAAGRHNVYNHILEHSHILDQTKRFLCGCENFLPALA